MSGACGIGWAANQPGGGGGGDADATPITSAAILETRWPAVGGVHTITQGGEFQLLAGETVIDIGANQIEVVYPAALSSRGGRVTIRSTADGPVVFGEVSMCSMQIESFGVGPNSMCVDIESLAGRTLKLVDVALVGQDPGIVHNVFGPITRRYMEQITIADGAAPLRFDGTIGGALSDGSVILVAAGSTTPYIAVQVLATCSVIIGFAVDRAVFGSVSAGDAMLDISTSATVSADFLFTVSGCQVNGPGSLFLPGSVDDVDPKMIASGHQNAPNSLWLGDALFDDPATPIILTHTGGATWDVVPFENAAAAMVLTVNPLTQRFALNRDALQDWQFKGTGRTDDKAGSVAWSAQVARSGGGGARPFSGRMEYSPDLGSSWLPITESESTIEMAGTSPATVAGLAPFTFNRSTWFRLTALGNAATATAISKFTIVERGQ